MAIIFPRSQPLRFVNMVNYPNNPYTLDSLLLQDDYSISDEPYIYTKKFDTNDNIIVYVTTDDTTQTLKVYNLLDEEVQSVAFIDAGNSSGNFKGKYAIIDTSLLGGIYYCIATSTSIGSPTYTYQCDYFEIDNYIDMPKLEYWNNPESGIYYTNPLIRFSFRIAADIKTYNPDMQKESAEAFNSVIIDLKTKIKRIILLKTDEIARYEYEKIILALAHKEVYINGVQYIALNLPKGDIIPDSKMVMLECELAQVNYEVYDEITEAGNGEPPTDTGILSIDGTDLLSIDGTNYLKVY